MVPYEGPAARHPFASRSCVRTASRRMWDLEDAELHVSIATNTPRIDRSTPKSLECALPLRTHWTRLRRKGYIVLRYTRDHVMREWPMIETTILGLVQAGKHLTGAQLRAS